MSVLLIIHPFIIVSVILGLLTDNNGYQIPGTTRRGLATHGGLLVFKAKPTSKKVLQRKRAAWLQAGKSPRLFSSRASDLTASFGDFRVALLVFLSRKQGKSITLVYLVSAATFLFGFLP